MNSLVSLRRHLRLPELTIGPRYEYWRKADRFSTGWEQTLNTSLIGRLGLWVFNNTFSFPALASGLTSQLEISSSTVVRWDLYFDHQDTIFRRMSAVSSSSSLVYLVASSKSRSALSSITALLAITNLEALSCKKTENPCCFRSLIFF